MRFTLLALFVLFFTLLGISTIVEKSSGDYVVILYGIARSSDNMRSMADFLETQGYDTINLDYPSTKYGLKDLAKIMHNELAVRLVEDKPIHFVSHSMGGLLVRVYLNKYRPKNLGKTIMLAPPNNGSEIADFLKNNQIYRTYYGPAAEELITNQDLVKNLFGEVDYPLGIIAGNRTIDPLSSAIIPNEDDGKVSINSTKLEGMSDHIVIEATHTFIANNKLAQKQTAYFLQYGHFLKELTNE